MADVISLILTTLLAISWIVAMAGVAAYDSKDGVKAVLMAFDWWTVWFQFFLTIFAGIVAAAGLNRFARLRTDMFLMVTVLWMFVANDANKGVDVLAGDYKSAAQAVLAGSIMVLLVNFALLIYWGLTDNGTNPIQLGRRAAPTPGGEAAAAAKVAEAVPVPAVPVNTV